MPKRRKIQLNQSVYFREREQKRRRFIFRLKIYAGASAFFLLLIICLYLVVYSPIFRVQTFVTRINADGSPAARSQINADNINVSQHGDADLEKALVADLKNFYASRSKLAYFLGGDNILIWNPQILPQTKTFQSKYAQISDLRIKKDYLRRKVEIEFKKRDKFGIWCLQRGLTQIDTRINSDNTSVNQLSNQRGSAIGSISVNQRESVLMNQRESASSSIRVNQSTNQSKSVMCGWFDQDGVLFAEAPQAEGNLIYKVDDASGGSLALGDKVLEERLIPNLFKIFSFLEQSGFNERNLKLENLALEEIATDAIATSSPKIYFSLRFDPAFGLKALESDKKEILNKAKYLDLRVENRIYYK